MSEARQQRLSPAGVENARRHVAIGKCYPSTTSLTFPWLQVLNRSPIDPSVRIPGLTRTSLICFLHDGCGKSEGGEGIWRKARSLDRRQHHHGRPHHPQQFRLHLRLQSRVQCPPTKTQPKQCCLPFQRPHKGTRRLFRVIFMTKARLIQL